MRASATKISAVALAGLLSLSLAACGDDDESSTGASKDPVATISDLSGGVSTAVKVDPKFLAALQGLGVTPAPVGSGKLTDGSLIFPITGGNVTLYNKGAVDPYVQGAIQHNGSGLSLTAGGIKVSLENFVVDPGKSVLTGKVSANGAVVAESANLFFLDGRTLAAPAIANGQAVLQGTTVSIHPDAAALLNKTYKLTGDKAIPDYFTVGIATITAKVPAA